MNYILYSTCPPDKEHLKHYYGVNGEFVQLKDAISFPWPEANKLTNTLPKNYGWMVVEKRSSL